MTHRCRFILLSLTAGLALPACGEDAPFKCVGDCPSAQSGQEPHKSDAGAKPSDDQDMGERAAPLDSWRTGEPMPGTAVAYARTVVVSGELFVLGGRTLNADLTGGQPVLTVRAFDSESEQWTEHETLPQAFDEPNVAAVGSAIYVLGWKGARQLYRYDVADREWTQIGERPVDVGLGASAVATAGSKIYLAGGVIPSENPRGARQTDFVSYDTEDGEWEQLPDAPAENAFHGAAIVDGVLYTSGGSTEVGDVARKGQTFAFDLKAQEWTETALMPIPVSSMATAAVAQRIYFIGGVAGATGRINPEIQVFDTQTQTWSIGENMPTPRFAMGAVEIDGEIYVPGGVKQISDIGFEATTLLEILGR